MSKAAMQCVWCSASFLVGRLMSSCYVLTDSVTYCLRDLLTDLLTNVRRPYSSSTQALLDAIKEKAYKAEGFLTGERGVYNVILL